MEYMNTSKIDITNSSILRVIAFICGIWILFQIRSIMISFFVSFALMTAIAPMVKLASKYKIPPIIVVLSLFTFLVSLMVLLTTSLMPAIVSETQSLIQNFPQYIKTMEGKLQISIDQNMFADQLSGIPSNMLRIAVGTFGNLLSILAVFFMTYYLTLDRKQLSGYIAMFFGKIDANEKAERYLKEVEQKIGGWVRGELILMFLIGIAVYFGLLFLRVPYALPLSILAGLCEAVPSIGPIFSAIPAIIIALTISPITALAVLILSIMVHQLENNIFVPKIMQAVTGVAPIVTIVVLMIGFTLGGIMGAILAIPIFLVINTTIRHISFIQGNELL